MAKCIVNMLLQYPCVVLTRYEVYNYTGLKLKSGRSKYLKLIKFTTNLLSEKSGISSSCVQYERTPCT
jgi:hypothetical protein